MDLNPPWVYICSSFWGGLYKAFERILSKIESQRYGILANEQIKYPFLPLSLIHFTNGPFLFLWIICKNKLPVQKPLSQALLSRKSELNHYGIVIYNKYIFWSSSKVPGSQLSKPMQISWVNRCFSGTLLLFWWSSRCWKFDLWFLCLS